MSKLRNVRTEINKMRKEMEAKEAELRKEKLTPSIEAMSEALLEDEAVCNVLDGYSKDEIRVISSYARGGRKIFCVYGKNSSLIRNRYV